MSNVVCENILMSTYCVFFMSLFIMLCGVLVPFLYFGVQIHLKSYVLLNVYIKYSKLNLKIESNK